MELEFECPACFAAITVDSAMHGRHVQCPACEAVVSVPRIDLEPGMEIGNFVLQSRLGAGGMGEVWLARQATMERDVALKILNPELSADKEFVAGFLKEVRISAQLEHENIVTAHDAGNATGFHYLAMSYIDGIELEAKLKGGLISEKEALGIARDIADALGYAWNKSNLLHRDIKPENIMVTADGSARLMDMGISKSRDEMSLTMTGMVVGTPYYMSPEQGRGSAEIDCRSDIYSLGATLYHALTGSVPFDAGTHVAILTQHATDPLPPPRRRNPKLSAPCAALIEKMMAKNPAKRPQTWGEVLADIENVVCGRKPGLPGYFRGNCSIASRAVGAMADFGLGRDQRLVAAVALALALVFGASGDPRRAATVLSLFFLALCGLANLSSVLEELCPTNPWRTKLRMRAAMHLLASFVCLVIMFWINPAATVLLSMATISAHVIARRTELGQLLDKYHLDELLAAARGRFRPPAATESPEPTDIPPGELAPEAADSAPPPATNAPPSADSAPPPATNAPPSADSAPPPAPDVPETTGTPPSPEEIAELQRTLPDARRRVGKRQANDRGGARRVGETGQGGLGHAGGNVFLRTCQNAVGVPLHEAFLSRA